MIPADVDMDALAHQLSEDSVAFGPAVSDSRAAELEPGLIDAAAHAQATEFGSLGIVVLESAPAHAPDMRDVAQDLLFATDLDTVIVRAPFSGAVISDVHSRSDLESAQHPYLGDPEMVGATRRFIDDVNTSGVNWFWVAAVVLAAVLAVAAFTAFSARRRPQGSSAQA